MQIRTPLCLAVLSSLAAAQVTTPVGFNATEGNQVFFNFAGARRLQSIDASQSAAAAVWTRFSMRRDGASATSASYAARTCDVQVTLGPASLGVISADLSQNLVGSTVVYARRSTNMPDWTTAPGAPPAAFDFNLTLDAPYTHAGGAFVWEVENGVATVTTQTVVDRQYNAYGTSSGALIAGSVGCIATGRTTAFGHTTAFRNGGAITGAFGMHLQVAATNAPSTAPVLLSIDTVDSALSVPFLCTTLHAQPTLLLPLGTSSATGAVPAQHITFAHSPNLVGSSLVTQLVSIDAGQQAPFLPIALSNGRTTTMPADPTVVCSPACYGFATPPATTGTLFFGGCIIVELQ